MTMQEQEQFFNDITAGPEFEYETPVDRRPGVGQVTPDTEEATVNREMTREALEKAYPSTKLPGREDTTPQEDHYLTAITVPAMSGSTKGGEQNFESPTYDDAIAGVASLVIELLQSAPAARGVLLRIYHVSGAGQMHQVTELRVDNVREWHPKGGGPRVKGETV